MSLETDFIVIGSGVAGLRGYGVTGLRASIALASAGAEVTVQPQSKWFNCDI